MSFWWKLFKTEWIKRRHLARTNLDSVSNFLNNRMNILEHSLRNHEAEDHKSLWNFRADRMGSIVRFCHLRAKILTENLKKTNYPLNFFSNNFPSNFWHHLRTPKEVFSIGMCTNRQKFTAKLWNLRPGLVENARGLKTTSSIIVFESLNAVFHFEDFVAFCTAPRLQGTDANQFWQ